MSTTHSTTHASASDKPKTSITQKLKSALSLGHNENESNVHDPTMSHSVIADPGMSQQGGHASELGNKMAQHAGVGQQGQAPTFHAPNETATTTAGRQVNQVNNNNTSTLGGMTHDNHHTTGLTTSGVHQNHPKTAAAGRVAENAAEHAVTGHSAGQHGHHNHDNVVHNKMTHGGATGDATYSNSNMMSSHASSTPANNVGGATYATNNTGGQGRDGQGVASSFRQDSHIISSTAHGIQSNPIAPSVDSTMLHQDYLPKKNHQWIQTLITSMDSMSNEIDRAAKSQQETISQEAKVEIDRILAANQLKQKSLIESMHRRAQEFESEYAKKRSSVIAQLDKEESVLMQKLQTQLKMEQEKLAAEAKLETERITQLARERKLTVLGEAQAQQDSLSQGVTTTTSQSFDTNPITQHHLLGKAERAVEGAAAHHHNKSPMAAQNERSEVVDETTRRGEPSARQQIA